MPNDKHRVALITGGTKGIGRAIALAMAASGHAVVVTYAHDAATAAAVEQQAAAQGLALCAARCDVTVATEVDALLARQGDVQVLVNNAGNLRDGLMMMTPEADFRSMLDVHLMGAFFTTRRVLRGMIAGRFGRVINIVSPSAFFGLPGQTAYSAAKAALVGLTRTLAREVARFGITVNAVSPGLVDTAMTAQLPENARARMLEAIPLRRPGRPEEIAAAVRFLASDEAAYITGQVLAVDGGLT
jgi:3-oxoacyl-[acyl-carrier protein] reductase